MTQHIIARGPKAGTWGPCTAKRACRNESHVEDEELQATLLWEQARNPDRAVSLAEITPALVKAAVADESFSSFVFEARFQAVNEQSASELGLSRRTRRHLKRDNPLARESGRLTRRLAYLRLPKAVRREAEVTWHQLQPNALPLQDAFFDYLHDEEPNLAQANMFEAHRFEAMDEAGNISDFFLLGKSRPMSADEYDAYAKMADELGRAY